MDSKPFVLPGQPTRYARDKTYEILHTKLEVELDFEKKSIAGKAIHALNAASPISFIELDSSELKIHSVMVDGKDARYSAFENKLRIDCNLPMKDAFNVEIEYTGTPKKGLYFRGPTREFPNRFVHAFTQGQAEDSKYWFPCYDYPNMRATSEVMVKTAKEMTAISNGILVSTKEEDGKKIWHFKQDVPHSSYLLSLIVGEYERLQEEHKGLILEYYFPSSRKSDVARSFAKTPKMIDFFSSITGQPYPYPKYSQSVVSDFMFGGMENITATTLTEKTLHDERSHLDFTSDALVAHELVHQWFGDYLTCRDWSHAWLNEGFANFFTAMFREHDEGNDEYQYFFNGYKDLILDEIDEHYDRPMVTKTYFSPEEMFDSHTYEKGAWVLNALRGYLGDEAFLKGIKNYVSLHRASLVETFDFRKAMEGVSGINLEPFFEQWVYSQGFPEYNARYTWDSKTVILSIEQANAGSAPLFTTPFEISLTMDSSVVKRKVSMSSKSQTFYFPLENEPLNVSIDPSNWLLKKLNFEKPERMYIFQLKNDVNTMERVRACIELSKSKSDDAIESLSNAIDYDKYWGVGLEAASNLGKIGTKKALDALIARKDHKHHKVRRGIAIGLRNFTSQGDNYAAIRTLIDYLNNDYSYFVRAFSANSLGFYKTDEAFEALKSALDQESVNDQIRYRVFLGLAEHKDARGLDLAIHFLKNGIEYQSRLGAAYAIGRLGRGKPEALQALIYAKNDPDVRIRAGAASAVHRLEDKSAIPLLEDWLASEPSGRCKRRIRESIYFLKEGMQDVEKLKKLEEDVQKLRNESRELKEIISRRENN